MYTRRKTSYTHTPLHNRAFNHCLQRISHYCIPNIHNQETQRTDERMGHHSLKRVLLRNSLWRYERVQKGVFEKSPKRCPLNIYEVDTILYSSTSSFFCLTFSSLWDLCHSNNQGLHRTRNSSVCQQLHDGIMAALFQTSWLLNCHRTMVATKNWLLQISSPAATLCSH